MTGFEILILFIIVYWLFGPRVLAMVDVLSTRLQAIYNPWERIAQPDSGLSPFIQKQVAQKRRERDQARAQNNAATARVNSNDLASIKTRPYFGFPPRPRQQLKGGACRSCDANVQESINLASAKEQDVLNVLDIEEQNSDNFLVRSFCYLVHNFRVPNYRFATICDTVLTDERVQDAIAETTSEVLSEAPDTEHTDESYRKIFAANTRKAKQVIVDMHSAMSNLMLKITSYLMYKLLPRFVTSVCVHPSQVEMVKRAAATNLPIIFVPLHRSHLDYILIIFTLLNNNIRPPLTAAGINLKIPVFGILLRWLGAFYIKRRIEPSSGSKDIIYRSALHSYMVQCLKAGHNIKFYIEGGRTRTGKPCLPKVGLLSVIVDAYMDGTVEDALLVPVSVNYDKLVDGNFIRELLGQPKEKETFSAAMKAIWATLNSSYGSCRIDFNQPFSLRELVNSFQTNVGKAAGPAMALPSFVPVPAKPAEGPIPTAASLSSLHGTDVVSEDHRLLVEHIANHLVFDCAAACAVMSTNVLAFILLNKCRAGAKLGVLVNLFDDMRTDLTSLRRDVGFSGASIDVVNSALSLLGPGLVKRERPEGASEWDELITPVTMLPNVIELSYYGNALTPQYALQGVVATSAFAMMKAKTDAPVNSILLNENDLIQHSFELCEILQFEFVFHKPCQDLESVLYQTVNDFKTKGLLPSLKTNQPTRSYGYDDPDESDEDAPVPAVVHKVSSSAEHMEELKLYNMTLRPLIDTYIATVMALYKLIGRQMTESAYAKEVIEELRSHLDTGYCLYGESCSVDPIKNACKVLKKWGVVETFTKDSLKLVYLSQAYDNRDAIRDLISRVTVYKWSDAL